MPEDPKNDSVGKSIATGFLFSVTTEGLSPDQTNHISEVGKQFCLAMAHKYVKGQREHGGNIWDLTEDQLLEMAIEEAIDQVVYLITIKGKRNGIRG